MSLSCGFAEAGYRRVTTPGVARLNDDANAKSWKALVLLGHYCKLNEYVLDGWHLVAYRTWRGKDYLIDFAEILVGEDGRLYVDDSNFIENTELESVAHSAAQTSDAAVCAESGSECPNRRIYVESIPMPANNSLERKREN